MDPATIRSGFPFDVLGVIFEHYLDNETIEFSLETMLSVCRSWNTAVLGHRNLWARLKIRIGHFPTSEIWKIRLPRRLERAGDFTPLEIDLRIILDTQDPQQEVETTINRCNRRTLLLGYGFCPCINTARLTAKELLVMLAGPHGELCHRWKLLHLCLDGILPGNEMTYPTPNLEVAWLERLHTKSHLSILPSIPKLKTLEIRSSYNFALPSMENVRSLTIRNSDSRDLDLSILKTAINLENLTIGIREYVFHRLNTVYSLPEFLPYLSSVSLSRTHLPSNLKEVQAPNIRRLSLKFDDVDTLQTVADSSLPFWNLQELELTWPKARYMYEKWRTTTSNIILASVNLTRIKGNWRSLSVIMKLYWEKDATRRNGKKELIGQALSFWSINEEKEVSVSRPESKSELEGAAMSLGLIPPSMSWDNILMRL
jgi:hypothetical protein